MFDVVFGWFNRLLKYDGAPWFDWFRILHLFFYDVHRMM